MTGSELADLIAFVCQQWQETSDTCSLLDNELGDGDHGISIHTGTQAILARLETYKDGLPSEVLKAVSRDFLSAVGASIGPLYATGLLRMAAVIANQEWVDSRDVPALFSAFVQGLSDRGKAHLGEKTMMDVWLPALAAFQDALKEMVLLDEEALQKACQHAVRAGNEGVQATKEMVATKGRASRLGIRSKGFIDPGAYSAFQLLRIVMAKCTGLSFPGTVVDPGV